MYTAMRISTTIRLWWTLLVSIPMSMECINLNLKALLSTAELQQSLKICNNPLEPLCILLQRALTNWTSYNHEEMLVYTVVICGNYECEMMSHLAFIWMN